MLHAACGCICLDTLNWPGGNTIPWSGEEGLVARGVRKIGAANFYSQAEAGGVNLARTTENRG